MGAERPPIQFAHCMKQVNKSVLLWHSAEHMFQVVTAVEDYPLFLPWCERVDIMEQAETGMTARIHLAFAGVRSAFTTRNAHDIGRSVDLALVDGPFSVLNGRWDFLPISGGGEGECCRVTFALHYAFVNRALEAAINPVFERIASGLVDAFVQRADARFG